MTDKAVITVKVMEKKFPELPTNILKEINAIYVGGRKFKIPT